VDIAAAARSPKGIHGAVVGTAPRHDLKRAALPVSNKE